MTQQDREILDLGYLDPTSDDFALNDLSREVLGTGPDAMARPWVALYAAPIPLGHLDLPSIRDRLADSERGKVEPVPGYPLVPHYVMAVHDGVLAHDGGEWRKSDQVFVVRMTGSFELLLPEVVSPPDDDGRYYLYQTMLVVRFAQLLNYLAGLGTEIDRTSWLVLANVRNAGRARMGRPARAYRHPLAPDEDGECVAKHLQFKFTIDAGESPARTAAALEFDLRLNFAYGFDRARAHAPDGSLSV